MKKRISLAVLGDPIAHSKSPIIHQAFAEQWGEPVDYQAIRCSTDALSNTLEALYQRGFQGVNLTVPLKEKALGLCDQLHPDAELAQAVNTLIRTPSGFLGTNTDGQGLVDDLIHLNITLDNKRILLIGAGGAAAGVCGPLLQTKLSTLAIVNRTPNRADELAARLRDPRVQTLSLTSTAVPFDLIIQATSAGHRGEILAPPSAWLNPRTSIYDLNYGAAHAPLAQWGSEHDLVVFDGLGMLVRQAALSFQHWTGFMPEAGPVIAELRVS